VTIDAMGEAGQRFRQAQPDGMARQGCQHEIAQKIIDKGADYILALKGNQGRLREDVEVFATEQQGRGFQDTVISRAETVDGDHGRIETRTVTVLHDMAWLQHRHEWPGLKAGHRREPSREWNQNRARDPVLYHLTAVAGRTACPGHSRPLGGREQSALGHGHDFPRR
jgi:predicted transposase YbfD/YdcC